MPRVLVVALLVTVACGHAESAPTSSTPSPVAPSAPAPSPTPAAATPTSGAAPDHDACTTDADCIIAAERDAAGCCIADPKPRPMSRAFVDWREARRASACPDPCMSPPVPVALVDCETIVRCANGRCDDACP